MANYSGPVVEPRAGATPAPAPEAPAEESAAPQGGGELPDDLLKVPAMQAITAGQPAAFSAILSQFEKVPEAKLIADNKDALMQAGFGFYRSLDGQKGAVFNQLFVSPDEIKAADQAGQLDQVAPPFDQLNMDVAKMGEANPVLAEGARPEGFRAGAAPVGASPAPLPASAQKTLASKRANALTPKGPTSGAAPGAGRLLNSILSPVV